MSNDGEGARLYGGRWNHKGTAVLYCAATASLCALEVLVHSDSLPTKMVLIKAEIPDGLTITELTDANLPKGWKRSVAPRSTKDLGTKWVKSKSGLVLSVPSSVVPSERNYLLNPGHHDFATVRFFAPEPFAFDKRLKPA